MGIPKGNFNNNGKFAGKVEVNRLQRKRGEKVYIKVGEFEKLIRLLGRFMTKLKPSFALLRLLSFYLPWMESLKLNTAAPFSLPNSAPPTRAAARKIFQHLQKMKEKESFLIIPCTSKTSRSCFLIQKFDSLCTFLVDFVFCPLSCLATALLPSTRMKLMRRNL